MENIGRIIKSPEARKYIYVVAIAAIPLLVGYGLINENDVDNITVFIGAVLGLSTTALAVANTPSTTDAIESIDSGLIEAEEEKNNLEDKIENVTSEAISEISEVKEILNEIIERLENKDFDEKLGE